MKVIQVTDVVLGDAGCILTCCITDNDCTGNASANHTADVHRICDGKNSCTVNVITEEFTCWYFLTKSKNDFERITYNCGNDSRSKMVFLFRHQMQWWLIIINFSLKCSTVLERLPSSNYCFRFSQNILPS